MDCSKAEKLLVEYLYQELSPEKTLEIEKHLETCDACAKTLENWRGIHRGFQRSNEIPQPTPFLKTRILAAAREERDRRPALAERLLVWLKPALILPLLIFGLLVLLFLPQKQSDVAKAKAPAQAETPAPAPVSREAQPPIEQKPEEKLKSTGSISDSKLAQQAKQEQPADELRRKTEGTPTKDRDQYASGAPSGQEKDQRFNEPPAVAASKEAEPSAAYEVQPQETARQETGTLTKKTVVAPAAAQTPGAPAAAPQAATEGAGGKLDSTLENFQKAQSYFKNNDLPQGKNVAEEAIRADKGKSLAPQFHEAGRQYQSQGEPQQAIVQYNLVLNNYPEYPGSPDVLLRLGESYEQIGEYGKAIRTYQQLQRIPAMQKVATEKMRTLGKKKEVQEQLRSLGYVDKN